MKNRKLEKGTLQHFLDCPCLSLRQSSRLVAQLFDDSLVPVGLTSTQLPVLVLLALYQPLAISRLASLLVMDRTTLTRTLKPLYAREYIKTGPTSDKRKSLLELTPKGHEMLVESYPLWKKAQEQVVDGVGVHAWKTVRKNLEKIVHIAGRRV